jgi:hypothetical protein
MTMFIQNDATGAGAGNVDPQQAFVDLLLIANLDTGVGLAVPAGNRQQVTYVQTDMGIPATRLNALVNTAFTPDYGLGAGPQPVNIIVLPVMANFTLNDGTMITNVAGTALSPSNSGQPGSANNNTNDCLVIYDTSQSNGLGYCLARAGTGGTLDLGFPNSVILYHELSHALRVVNNGLLALGGGCNPSSPEENAAITDENDMRTQRAAAAGVPAVLRDAGIHCGNSGPCGGGGGGDGGCCIVATVASGSAISAEVSALRAVRDGLLRRSEVGYAFFQSLHHDYYAFSPQVCTLMAGHPELYGLVLEGFVRPLVYALRVVEAHVLYGATAVTLGDRFARDHADADGTEARLRTLSRARNVLSGGSVALTRPETTLASLLMPGLASEHVRWALLQPIQIYESALRTYAAQANEEAVGVQLLNDIESWGSRMPLQDVWASLSAEEVARQLVALDAVLLRSPAARSRFRERLRQKFGDMPAVAKVAGHSGAAYDEF